MSRKLRLLLGMVLFLVALTLLVWGWMPMERMSNTLLLPPVQLPKPSGSIPGFLPVG
jgi:hypothetical protein